jgi:glycosyltransferase involved in cell wall biosynthesis
MISVIIPAYNEERSIEHAIREVARAFRGNEIIVVSDGSDRTGEISESLRLRDTPIAVLRFRKRMGKWGSIIRGIKAARGEHIIFLDVDLSVSVSEARRLMGMLDGYDVIISSRYKRGSRIVKRQPISRMLLSRIFNYIVRLPFFIRFRDTQCGCKAFRSDIGKRVSANMRCRGFEGDVEFLWLAKRIGARIREEPVTWSDDNSSTLKVRHMFLILFNILRARAYWLVKPLKG